MVNTNWYQFYLIRFGKDLSVCTKISYVYARIRTPTRTSPIRKSFTQTILGPVLESDIQTTIPHPPSLQKWSNWNFGPKRCVMFWNVYKNGFPIYLYFFRLTNFKSSPILMNIFFGYVSEEFKDFFFTFKFRRKKILRHFSKHFCSQHFFFYRIYQKLFWSEFYQNRNQKNIFRLRS